MTALSVALRAALTAEWQSTQALRDRVASRQYRPALSDVAATLRQLRREGVAEREARGVSGHAWRKATSNGGG